MSFLKDFFHTSEKFLTDNSPAVLTGIGVVGTISTAVLSARAHVRATDLIRQEDPVYYADDPRDAFDWKDKARLTWKIYIPPVSVAALTCTSIICANRIGTRRTAALAAAYATSEKAFTEYRDKVVEKMGEKEEQKVREEVAADRIRNNPPTDAFVEGEDRQLFYDMRNGRYFYSTMQDVEGARNHINDILIRQGDVSLNTFYSWLGLDSVYDGEEMGWRRDKGLLDMQITGHVTDKGRSALAMNFRVAPIRNYNSAHGA